MRLQAQAFNKDDFENRLTALFGGLCGEYLKWKTAEALGADISSWKTESENLLADWLKYFLTAEVKGSIRLDIKKKQKILHRLMKNWQEIGEIYYRFALKELKLKGIPNLRREQMPAHLLEDLLDWMKKEIEEETQALSAYPTLRKVLGLVSKK